MNLQSLFLASAVRPPYDTLVTPRGTAVLSTLIAVRCINRSKFVHSLIAESSGDHDFWTQHFHLDETIRDSLSHLLLPVISHATADQHLWLARITLQAALICLHQAAIKFARLTNVPAPMIADSPTRCMNAALDISITTKQIRNLSPSKVRNQLQYKIFRSANEQHRSICLLDGHYLQRPRFLSARFISQL